MGIVEFIVQLLISVLLSYAIGAILRKKLKEPEVGQLDIVNPDASSPVPVCFGTNIIKSSNVIWYGNPKTTKVKTSSGK
jgi:hypothetical protein